MANNRDSRADAFDNALGLSACNPGHNVFAEKEVRTHRARLQGNAFYQQQYLQERGLPLDTLHPAFADKDLISDLSKPIPIFEPQQRESNATTMSRFVDAGREQPSPLNLGTTPEHTPQPTQRAWVEERTEQRYHQQFGGMEKRTPGFRPAPELESEEFDSAKSSTKKLKEVRIADQTTEIKSPQRSGGFFSRFGFGRREQNQASPAPTSGVIKDMPPKAQQIFGMKDKTALGRSPSKTKGFFTSRSGRKSGGTDLLEDAATANATPTATASETPRAATWLGHYRGHTRQGSESANRGKLQVSTSSEPSTVRSDHSTPRVGRSQSLKYIDHRVPPTPPSKDTPPDERAVQNATISPQNTILDFQTNTPSRSTGFVSTQRDRSPTRVGTYAQRGAARLVTKPSMHSLRASVMPGEMDQGMFEEANARLGGLGLEGFSLPVETRRQRYHEEALKSDEYCSGQRRGENQYEYSPSIYSPNPDWGRRSVGAYPLRAGRRFQEPLEELDEGDETMQSPPQQMTMRNSSPLRLSSPSPDDRSTMSVPVVYPDLLNDPSISSFMRYQGEFSVPNQQHIREIGEMLREDSPTMGNLVQPVLQVDPFQRGSSPSPGSSQHLLNSPHPSDNVSPLRMNAEGQEVLPDTVYSPQMKVKRRMQPNNTPTKDIKETKSSLRTQRMPTTQGPLSAHRGAPSEHDVSRELRHNVFDNKPNFTSVGAKTASAHSKHNPKVNVDPKKSPNTRRNFSSPPTSNNNNLSTTASKKSNTDAERTHQNIMSTINERNKEMQEMTTEAARTNAAIETRLACSDLKHLNDRRGNTNDTGDSGVEMQDGKNKQKADVGSSSEQHDKDKKKNKETRLSTSFAHEFYRQSPQPEAATSTRTSEASTIILTPDLPDGQFPRNKAKGVTGVDLAGAAAARQLSGTHPALRGSAPAPAIGEASVRTSAAAPSENERVELLTSAVQQQQVMMAHMFAHIKRIEQQMGSLQMSQQVGQSTVEIEEGSSDEEDTQAFFNPA